MENSYNSPSQIADNFSKTICVKKASAPFYYLAILGFLAGVFISFGGMFSTLAGFESAKYLGLGMSKLISGLAFSVGLILVVVGGAELFTGNNLIILSVLTGNIPWKKLLRNWVIIYIFNFVGAFFIAWFYYSTGLWKTTGSDPNSILGYNILKIAVNKVNLTFWEAFSRGVLCNWIVCMAVWLADASKDITGKILSIIFPITAFAALGFEHSVANMYSIPLGMFLRNASFASEIESSRLLNLNLRGFFLGNLAPVTIGNIIGGAFFVGFMYWFAYLRKQ
jgi:formate transporter